MAVSQFKYLQLKQWLIDQISAGIFRPGDLLPSEHELCSKFSVSRQTVRNALNELTTNGVIHRERGSGTFVNRQIEQNRDKTIGVLLSYASDYIFPDVLCSIEAVLSKQRYGIDLGITYNNLKQERMFLERMIDSNVSGLLIEGTRSALPNPNIKYYEEFLRRNLPVVFIHNYYLDLPYSAFILDEVNSFYRITQKLIKKGHTQIGGIFKLDDMQGQLRYKGYMQALLDAEIDVCDEHIWWFSTENQKKGIAEYMRPEIETLKNCSALVCYNDMVADQIYRLLAENGLQVPDDISMVGCDNHIEKLNTALSLTTIQYPYTKIGDCAVRFLMDQVLNNSCLKDRQVTRIPCEIIERNSIKEYRSK